MNPKSSLSRLEEISNMRTLATYISAGRWIVGKARRQAAEVGYQQAAKNLRKQGVPLNVALIILLG